MRRTGILTALGLAGLLWLAESAASEWSAFWGERDDANQEQVDHSAWQSILDTYLRIDSSEAAGAPPAYAGHWRKPIRLPRAAKQRRRSGASG